MAKVPKNMKLTAVIQKWLDSQEWADEIKIDEDSKNSLMGTGISQDGHDYKLWVEADEVGQRLKVFIYGPIGIPANRYDEACKLANGINQRRIMGRICALKESNFQFQAAVDVEGSTLAAQMIQNMVDAGLAIFKDWTNEMGQVIFAGISADKIFEEIDKLKEDPQEESVPDKL